MTTHATVKKYLVCPGFVISKRDGDRHWIDARRLIQLYQVDPEECLIKKDDQTPNRFYQGRGRELIVLRPKYDGDYPIFKR